MAGEIVVGYDGTEGAKAALGEARGSPRSSAPSSWSRSRTTARRSAVRSRTSHDALLERGQAVTGEALAAAAAAGVTARAELVHGHPAPALVELAEAARRAHDRGRLLRREPAEGR